MSADLVPADLLGIDVAAIDVDPDDPVTDDYVLAPLAVTDTVVVTFDGRYVWSFTPPRDGARTDAGWLVPWPAQLRARLDGTTAIRLSGPDGVVVHLDTWHSFRDNPASLSLVDAHGHPLAVDRAGHLARVFGEVDDAVRRQVVEGASRALRDLRESVGVEAHLSYGALLGAVREGRMIAHDTDIDLAYLSWHTHPADVVRESYRMERQLRGLGWKVVRMSGADLKLFLPLPDGRTVHIDVFGAFHVGETFYQLGGRSGRLPREALVPATTVMLEGLELPAPADPERALAFLYGPTWRVPDPAFRSEDPERGITRLDGWLRGPRTGVPEWNELLRQHRGHLPRAASTFGRWVHEQTPPDTTIVDIGAGNGRDSAFFAGVGRPVIALDYAGASLRQTRRKLTRLGVEPDVRVLVLGDLRSALLAGAELAREPLSAGGAPTLYARHLLGCLDTEQRANLWRLASMALRRGGSFHLEYTVSPGACDTAGPADHLISRLDPALVEAEVVASGGRVVNHEITAGDDFLDHLDTAVARLEARWDGPRPMPTTPGDTMSTTILTLPARLRELAASVQENRRLNRRVAELTDLVTELLVPVAERDDEKARELLVRYRESSFAP